MGRKKERKTARSADGPAPAGSKPPQQAADDLGKQPSCGTSEAGLRTGAAGFDLSPAVAARQRMVPGRRCPVGRCVGWSFWPWLPRVSWCSRRRGLETWARRVCGGPGAVSAGPCGVSAGNRSAGVLLAASRSGVAGLARQHRVCGQGSADDRADRCVPLDAHRGAVGGGPSPLRAGRGPRPDLRTPRCGKGRGCRPRANRHRGLRGRSGGVAFLSRSEFAFRRRRRAIPPGSSGGSGRCPAGNGRRWCSATSPSAPTAIPSPPTGP